MPSDAVPPLLLPDVRHLRELDRRHHLHPFTDHAALAATGTRVIVRAEGCHLWDAEGRRLLDAMAGLWCVNAGYGRRELIEAAAHQLETLPYYNSFFQCTSPPPVELAAELVRLAPSGLSRVFFANSGSEANESAIKLIRYYWNLRGEPRRKTIISRHFAYHGVTMGAASLSGLTPMHGQSDLPLPGFVHVDAPYGFQMQEAGEDLDAFGLRAARALEAKILELGPETIAAFVGEPVQGAGGVIIPPRTYWPEIQRICRTYGILLVADEVITGFGRTGHWFASDHFGIEPDLLTCAKGLSSGYVPIAALLVGHEVGDVLVAAGEEWTHGFTYSGHPVASAVALANLRLIAREGLEGRGSGPAGGYFRERLFSLEDHPLVGEVRTCGFLGAIELVADPVTRMPFPAERGAGIRCREHSLGAGLVMRAVRDVMVLAPPLIISRAEIDELVEKARNALDHTAVELGI